MHKLGACLVLFIKFGQTIGGSNSNPKKREEFCDFLKIVPWNELILCQMYMSKSHTGTQTDHNLMPWTKPSVGPCEEEGHVEWRGSWEERPFLSWCIMLFLKKKKPNQSLFLPITIYKAFHPFYLAYFVHVSKTHFVLMWASFNISKECGLAMPTSFFLFRNPFRLKRNPFSFSVWSINSCSAFIITFILIMLPPIYFKINWS